MRVLRYMTNTKTLLSWSLRRDNNRPQQCFIDKKYTVPIYPESVCDCIKYCKYGPRPSREMTYSFIQSLDDVVYSVTPLKVPVVDKKIPVVYKEVIVMYL